MGFCINGDERYPLNERHHHAGARQARSACPFVDLDPLKIDAKLAPQLLSRPFARKHTALIIAADDRNVTVAVANPLDMGLVDDLTNLVRRNPQLVISTPSEIQRLITDFYGFRGAVAAAEEQVSGGVDIGNLERSSSSSASRRSRPATATSSRPSSTSCTTRSTSARPTSTSSRDASSRSCACASTACSTRCTRCPKAVHGAVVSRIKTLARLDIAEKRRAQDGRIKTARGDREVELRVSTISIAFGEKLVIRVFDPEAVLRGLSELGMFDAQLAGRGEVPRAPERPHPRHRAPPGSGKTTHALRGAAHHRDAPRSTSSRSRTRSSSWSTRSTRSPSSPRSASTSPRRSATSCGKTRTSSWSARCATPRRRTITLQAALTGHLVLATLHTNDSAGGDHAPPRARRRPVHPRLHARRRHRAAARPPRVPELPRRRRSSRPTRCSSSGSTCRSSSRRARSRSCRWPFGEGCVKCRSTGLVGRTGVFEVLAVDDKIRKLIIAKRAVAGHPEAGARTTGL